MESFGFWLRINNGSHMQDTAFPVFLSAMSWIRSSYSCTWNIPTSKCNNICEIVWEEAFWELIRTRNQLASSCTVVRHSRKPRLSYHCSLSFSTLLKLNWNCKCLTLVFHIISILLSRRKIKRRVKTNNKPLHSHNRKNQQMHSKNLNNQYPHLTRSLIPRLNTLFKKRCQPKPGLVFPVVRYSQ